MICPRCENETHGAACVCGWRPAQTPKSQAMQNAPKPVVTPAPADYLPCRLVMNWVRGGGALSAAIRSEIPKFMAETPKSDPDYARAEALLALVNGKRPNAQTEGSR